MSKKFYVKYIDLATGKTVEKTISEREQYDLYRLQREGKVSIITISWTSEEELEKELKIVEMYKSGVLVNKICADLGINMFLLYWILRKHKVPLRKEVKKNE